MSSNSLSAPVSLVEHVVYIFDFMLFLVGHGCYVHFFLDKKTNQKNQDCR